MSDAQAAANPEPKCDHVCLLDAGHVERGELHFYGYEIPSARAAAPIPNPPRIVGAISCEACGHNQDVDIPLPPNPLAAPLADALRLIIDAARSEQGAHTYEVPSHLIGNAHNALAAYEAQQARGESTQP